MVLYMAVTADEYELPVAVADSPKELAEMLGSDRNTISSTISHAKRRGSRSRYIKVVVDDETDGEDGLGMGAHELLKRLGIYPQLAGYRYIVEMLQLLRDGGLEQNVVDLYDSVAGRHGKSWKAVEKGVRIALGHVDAEGWELIGIMRVPRNKAAIWTMYEYLQRKGEHTNETADCKMG